MSDYDNTLWTDKFLVEKDGKWHFIDEAEQIDETAFDTKEEARKALIEYAKTL